jgi:hypothetical protein
MLGSNNPLLIQQSLFGNALDSLFGNPEVRQKTAVFDKVQKASASVPDVPGDALATETARMYAIRDAIGDKDPNVTSQIQARLVALEDERMQRAKLAADMTHTQAETLHTLGEEARAPGEARDKANAASVNLSQDLNDSENWFAPHSDASVNVLKTDSGKQEQLRKLGWSTHAPSTEAEATNRLGKKANDTLDDQAISADQALMALGQAGASYKPQFSNGFFQMAQAGAQWADRWGANRAIPDGVKADMPAYQTWRSDTQNSFNTYVHAITGAAMNKGEIERYIPVVPTAGDGTTAYLSKSRAAMERSLALRGYVDWAKKMGWSDDKIKGESVVKNEDKLTFMRIPEATLDAAMQHAFGTTGRGMAAASAPAGKGSATQRALDIASGKH